MSEKFTFEQQKGLKQKQVEFIFIERLNQNPITLIEEKTKNTLENLKEKFGDKKTLVCDFPITDIEKEGKENIGGFEQENFLNIDHHIPVKRMQKYISSTNLAIEYVKKYGIVGKEWIVVINHTDCDSVLSSTIMRGILEPKEEFGEAAIAADHTGKENKISDLLQALQGKRDLEFSLRNLEMLLKNQPLELEAEKMRQKRFQDRLKAQQIIKEGKVQKIGKVYFVILEEEIDAGLFPSLIPNAQIIMIAYPLKANPKKWEIKLRLGMNAPKRFILDKKIISEQLDQNYDGRWNAGANKRPIDGIEAHGGTDIAPEEYAKRLNKIIK